MEFLVFDDGGWGDNLGPTNAELNLIYRKRLNDPEMNPSHKSQMEILSSFRSRIVKLNLLPSVDVEMKNLNYSVNIEKETYNLVVPL